MFPWSFEGYSFAQNGEILSVIGHEMRIQGQQADERDVEEEQDVHYDTSARHFSLGDVHRNRVVCRLDYGYVERMPDSSPTKLLYLDFLLKFIVFLSSNVAS